MTHKKDTQVEIYRNLHNNRWSIRGDKTRLVLAHADMVLLWHVTFVVQQKGRERVLREQRKNVHAFARGHIVAWIGHTFKNRILPSQPRNVEFPTEWELTKWKGVSYNPYKFNYFYKIAGHVPVHECEYAFFNFSRGPIYIK